MRHANHNGAEELGGVYESLLELHPDLNAEAASFELNVATGSERKKTGSYYTPTSLISCLLDSALDPALLEAARQPEPEAAILKLKVVDPACGSGHFLIAAAHRIAKRPAAVRTGEEEPPPEAQRKAILEVIGHCIYGVDVNPMAVELCEVSLWMEALEPGKPLSFLEHRVQAGNSLLGSTPALLAQGVPDEAFTPIEGDDKEICEEFKRINAEPGAFLTVTMPHTFDGAAVTAWRDEREKQMRLFDATTEPWLQLGNLAASLMNLDTVGDDSIKAVREKERMYEAAIRSGDYLDGRFWADTWCAAFAWKKTLDLSYPITEEVFRRIERNPHSCEQWMRREIERLAREYVSSIGTWPSLRFSASRLATRSRRTSRPAGPAASTSCWAIRRGKCLRLMTGSSSGTADWTWRRSHPREGGPGLSGSLPSPTRACMRSGPATAAATKERVPAASTVGGGAGSTGSLQCCYLSLPSSSPGAKTRYPRNSKSLRTYSADPTRGRPHCRATCLNVGRNAGSSFWDTSAR
jgi:hypothetical protein